MACTLTNVTNERIGAGARCDEAQLAYAPLDTHYLIPLRERFKNELEEKGLLPLAQEDFQRLCRTNVPQPDEDMNAWWRVAARTS